MKTKDFFRTVMMAVMTAAVCMTLTACGGDDKEDDIPGGGAATGIGVHRIDVQYSDNAAGCRVMNIFYGVRKDGSMADLYENGGKLERDAMSGTWYTEELRDLSVQTEDGCGGMVATLSISGPNGRTVTSDVTVTVVGYVNGKRIKTQVFTLPAGSYTMAAGFTTGDTEEYKETVM